MSAPLCTTSRTSRALSFYIFLWILVSGFWTLPASAQPIGLNEDSRVVTLPTGEKVFEWYGQTGRSYFVQVSDPSDHLNKWNWAPVIEPGYNQSISHEVDATANKGFFRLQYTNQTASDLDNADFDGDGLTNLQEITPVLRPGTRAARSIIGGPLPPNTTQTNPLDPDTDHDGLTDFDEQLNGTDPTMADTDGGGSTDGDEVARGSNPNESGDDDHPPTDQVKDIDFKVYGDYASWIMHIEGLGPRDTRKLAIASPDVGIPATKPVKLWRNNRYKVTLEHTGSVEDDYAPWYCWEAHIENKPDEQTFPSYMPDRIADVGDFFSIGDGHWLVDNRCGLFTNHNHRTEEYGGNATEGLEAFIEPVDIDDNTAATGVDDVSVTADKNDIGYQDMFWILAPVGGTAFSDDMYFKIPLAPAANLKITSDNVSATPSTTSVSNASPGPVVTWRGTATESIDDPTTLWKFGPAEHEADLAIRVKSMKKRTVKVAFHAIASVVPGVANDAPDLIPSASVLQTKLNEIFGSQINAWFEVTLLQTESIAFDVANDTTTYPGFTFWSGSSHPVAGNRTLDFTAWSNPEVSLVTSNRSANYDIHVYVIGGATPFVTYERSPGSTTELRAVESLIGRADTLEGANYCIIDGDRDARTYDLDGNPTGYILDIKYRSVSAVIHTIAHEIGHIVVGGGHPNEGNEGPAPLVGTDRTKRLMCRGSESDQNSLLLVKKEWDKAEEWLKNRPNGDN